VGPLGSLAVALSLSGADNPQELEYLLVLRGFGGSLQVLRGGFKYLERGVGFRVSAFFEDDQEV
jgi:hypothetical protein